MTDAGVNGQAGSPVYPISILGKEYMPFLLPCNQSDAESAVGCCGNNAYHRAAYLEQACLQVRQVLELGVMEVSLFKTTPFVTIFHKKNKRAKGKMGKSEGSESIISQGPGKSPCSR